MAVENYLVIFVSFLFHRRSVGVEEYYEVKKSR